MQQIADKVGVHVTTVSRAVDDKWIQTPRGIFPLKRFFVRRHRQRRRRRSRLGHRAAQAARDHRQRRQAASAVSDDELVEELAKHGITVARRTVTKYRKAMNIPSSRQRRDWTPDGNGKQRRSPRRRRPTVLRRTKNKSIVPSSAFRPWNHRARKSENGISRSTPSARCGDFVRPAGLVDDVGHALHIFDPVEHEHRIGMVVGGHLDGADAQQPLDGALLDGMSSIAITSTRSVTRRRMPCSRKNRWVVSR